MSNVIPKKYYLNPENLFFGSSSFDAADKDKFAADLNLQRYGSVLENLRLYGTNGLLVFNNGNFVSRSILGISNQISVIDGNGVDGQPWIGLSSSMVLPGTLKLGTSFDANANRLTNLADPVNAQDAATKLWVERYVADKTPVVLASTPADVASGSLTGATYDNTAKTLTGGANGVFVLDGVTAVQNQRVLIKDMSSAVQNGLYRVSAIGGPTAQWVLVRTPDSDETVEMSQGLNVMVYDGSLNKQTNWYLTASATIGTDPIVFAQSSGITADTAGDGLQRNADGRKISLKLKDSSLAVDSTGLRINLAATSGLVSANGLAIVSRDTALTVGANDIGLTLATDSGLEIASGLKVKPSIGLKTDASGLYISFDASEILDFNAGALQIYSDATRALIKSTNAIRLQSGATSDIELYTGTKNIFSVLGSGALSYGEGSRRTIKLYGQTTDATQITLLSTGLAGTVGTDHSIALPNNSLVYVRAFLVGQDEAFGANKSYAATFEHLVSTHNNVTTILDGGAGQMNVVTGSLLSADALRYDGAYDIAVTGLASTTVDWTAIVEIIIVQ